MYEWLDSDWNAFICFTGAGAVAVLIEFMGFLWDRFTKRNDKWNV